MIIFILILLIIILLFTKERFINLIYDIYPETDENQTLINPSTHNTNKNKNRFF
jgi:hypothetical protein